MACFPADTSAAKGVLNKVDSRLSLCVAGCYSVVRSLKLAGELHSHARSVKD
jgi:hypothetical protein